MTGPDVRIVGPATTRDGTAVHLWPLRRDERELVARFLPGCRRSPGAAASCSPCRGCPRPCCDGCWTSTAATMSPWSSAPAWATLVYLVDPSNRPAVRLLRSLGAELAVRDGLVEGRQRLPGATLPVPALAYPGQRRSRGVGGRHAGRTGASSREVAWESGTSA